MPTIESLHIHHQVHTLFRNIGWEGLLSLHDASYVQPTLEFLSSVSFNNQTEYLSFRAFIRNDQSHKNQLCKLNGALVSNTYSQFHIYNFPFQ